MILRRLSRQRGSLQVASPFLRPVTASVAQSRSLHAVPELRYEQEFKANGVHRFLTRQGLDYSWTQYQTLLIDNLNRLTVDTPEEKISVRQLAINTSRWSDKAAIFNNASMAYNNFFFFDGLHPNAREAAAEQKKEDLMPRDLVADICNSFSSVDTLREEMIKTANAMFGPGFVWVVKDKGAAGMMKVLTTYIAGSPFPAAHARRQPVDYNTVTTNVIGNRTLTATEHNERLSQVQNHTGYFGRYSKREAESVPLAPGAMYDTEPILCVKVWEHGWLYDYAIGPRSKLLYLERWWESIDWDHIYKRTLDVKSPASTYSTNSLLSVNPALRRNL